MIPRFTWGCDTKTRLLSRQEGWGEVQSKQEAAWAEPGARQPPPATERSPPPPPQVCGVIHSAQTAGPHGDRPLPYTSPWLSSYRPLPRAPASSE